MSGQSHYRLKHPPDTVCDQKILEAVQSFAREGRITCQAAHRLAQNLGVAPKEVGKACDFLECRIVECQLGLFGYTPQKKIVKPCQEVRPELESRLRAHLSYGHGHANRRDTSLSGEISCQVCWQLAEELGLKKMEVSSACEGLGIKIKPCQLGAY